MLLRGHRVNGGCDDHHLDVWKSSLTLHHFNGPRTRTVRVDKPRRMTFV